MKPFPEEKTYQKEQKIGAIKKKFPFVLSFLGICHNNCYRFDNMIFLPLKQ